MKRLGGECGPCLDPRTVVGRSGAGRGGTTGHLNSFNANTINTQCPFEPFEMCGETGNGETAADGLCPAIADSADGLDCHADLGSVGVE